MNRFTEAIRDYEFITAGRYYSLPQRKMIFDLVGDANFLSSEARTKIADVIFSSDVEEYKNETDCANGLLLMSVLHKDNYANTILTYRKKTLTNLTEKYLWDSKNAWIRFRHTKTNNFYSKFDNAIYAYCAGDVSKTVTILMSLADACHGLSIKLLSALTRAMHNNQGEVKYLLLFKRIIEELYDEVLPKEFELRLEELLYTFSQNTVEGSSNIKLRYFDEYSSGMSRIGF